MRACSPAFLISFCEKALLKTNHSECRFGVHGPHPHLSRLLRRLRLSDQFSAPIFLSFPLTINDLKQVSNRSSKAASSAESVHPTRCSKSTVPLVTIYLKVNLMTIDQLDRDGISVAPLAVAPNLSLD
jgi:hypothetical protein